MATKEDANESIPWMVGEDANHGNYGKARADANHGKRAVVRIFAGCTNWRITSSAGGCRARGKRIRF